MNSVGKAFGLLVAGVIVVSIGAPSLMASGGNYLVMVLVLGLVLWGAIGGGGGTGFRWLPGSRRLFAWRVRPSAAVVPRAVLLGSAVWVCWTAVANDRVPDIGSALVVGLVGGVVWGVFTSVGRGVQWLSMPLPSGAGPVTIMEALFGFAAAVVSLRAVFEGDDCIREGRPGLALGFVAAAVLGSIALMAVLRLAGSPIIRGPFDPAALALSLAGLLELVVFVLAPAGEDVMSGASAGQRLGLVGGFAVAIVLTVGWPAVAELLLGYGIAIGGLALLVTGSSLTIDETHACRAYSPQLALVAAFTVAATIGAGWRTRAS